MQKHLAYDGRRWIPSPRAGKLFEAPLTCSRIACLTLAYFSIGWGHPYFTSFLLVGSYFLPLLRDGWKDSTELSIFGSGLMWTADIQVQIIILSWISSFSTAPYPALLLATTVQIANALFDFASTAKEQYPTLGPQSGFTKVLDWCMPSGRYSPLGTAAWLSYPIFWAALGLQYSDPDAGLVGYLLVLFTWLTAPLAALYCWCEAAYLVFLLSSWTETGDKPTTKEANTLREAGFQFLGRVTPEVQGLLRAAFDAALAKTKTEYERSCEAKEIFWTNLYQRSGNAYLDRNLMPGFDKLERWVLNQILEHYGPDVDCDGFGFICNPIGSRTQAWHLDYRLDYSTIFIPMTPVTTKNATQFITVPPNVDHAVYTKALADLDVVDVGHLEENLDWVCVQQMIARPFSMLKMNFGTIHRGISNTGDYVRVVFWMSAIKGGVFLPEEKLFVDFRVPAADSEPDKA